MDEAGTTPALVVIDMQREFLEGVALAPALPAVLERINWAAGELRRRGFPVIWVQDHDSVEPGDPGFELLAELDVRAADLRLTKRHGNAFRETPLAQILAERGVDLALFAGFKAEGCVLETALGAKDRDLPHALLRGAILSSSPDGAAFVERISALISAEVVESLLLDAGGTHD